MKNFTISVIIPIYNVERYIEKCINSVLKQTYKNIECIIVNDCTPDKSFEIVINILSSYNGNIAFKLIKHKENKGLSETRNSGIRIATGEYIYFLDSDDTIPEDCIQNLVDCAIENEKPEIVMGLTKGIDSDDALVEVSQAQTKSFLNNSEVFRGYLGNKWYVIACNKLIRKDIFASHNTYFVPGITHEDVMWSFEIATYINKIVLCPKTTYYYYIGDTNSISRSVWGEKRINDSITILEKKSKYLPKVDEKNLLAQHIKNECINIVYSLFRNKVTRESIKQYIKRIENLMNNRDIKATTANAPLYRKIIYYYYKFM